MSKIDIRDTSIDTHQSELPQPRLLVKQKLIAREFDKFYSSKNTTEGCDLDTMADSLENLNIIISNDLKKSGNKKITKRVKEVINWYRTLDYNPKCYVSTQEGKVFNTAIYHRVIMIFTKYFTILKDEVEEMGLME